MENKKLRIASAYDWGIPPPIGPPSLVKPICASDAKTAGLVNVSSTVVDVVLELLDVALDTPLKIYSPGGGVVKVSVLPELVVDILAE